MVYQKYQNIENKNNNTSVILLDSIYNSKGRDRYYKKIINILKAAYRPY